VFWYIYSAKNAAVTTSGRGGGGRSFLTTSHVEGRFFDDVTRAQQVVRTGCLSILFISEASGEKRSAAAYTGTSAG
jgi:hypothetical protein